MRPRLTDAEAVPVMRAAGLIPLEPYPGADNPWRCRCNACGGEVTPLYTSVRNGSGCRFCAVNKRSSTRRLTDAEAGPVMRAAGLIPLEPYPGATKAWLCECTICGERCSPSFHNVQKIGRGCRSCGIKQRSHSRKVNESEAKALMILAGVTPLETYPGSKVPWRCRCNACGREVTPRHSSIRQGRGGCIYCAGRGVTQRN
jgi:hypothetical protein